MIEASEEMGPEARDIADRVTSLHGVVSRLVNINKEYQDAQSNYRRQSVLFLSKLAHLVHPVLPLICAPIPQATKGAAPRKGVYVSCVPDARVYLTTLLDWVFVNTQVDPVEVSVLNHAGAADRGLDETEVMLSLTQSLEALSLANLVDETVRVQKNVALLKTLLGLLSTNTDDAEDDTGC
jgi:hypothetical protein